MSGRKNFLKVETVRLSHNNFASVDIQYSECHYSIAHVKFKCIRISTAHVTVFRTSEKKHSKTLSFTLTVRTDKEIHLMLRLGLIAFLPVVLSLTCQLVDHNKCIGVGCDVHCQSLGKPGGYCTQSGETACTCVCLQHPQARNFLYQGTYPLQHSPMNRFSQELLALRKCTSVWATKASEATSPSSTLCRTIWAASESARNTTNLGRASHRLASKPAGTTRDL